ncbi:hypothetical protein NL108_014031 [Boleophthalmus pectinirostris]|nr:hypothetical protein NL108_014031 [Boleophthalmus pectinirostris]
MTDPTGPRGGANSPALKTAVITTLVCLLLLTQVYSQGQQIQDQKDPQVHPVKDHAQAEAVPGIRCSNNTRQCWCVDESGSLIEGSYTSPLHSDLPDCEKSKPLIQTNCPTTVMAKSNCIFCTF